MIAGRRVAVVIPAYREQDLLPQTLRTLPAFVDRAVVVDDASPDQTGEVARACGAAVPVTVLRHEQNLGVGAAIVTGYRWCVREGLDVAVVVGADAQMHPDDMPALLHPLLQGEADYVTGDRLAWPQGWRAFPWVRLVGVVALAALTRQATGDPRVRDAQCGYTAITREALMALALDELYPRYGFPNDMLAKVLRRGLRWEARPVRPIYASEQSKLRVHKVVGPLLRLLARNWLARQASPARPLDAPSSPPAPLWADPQEANPLPPTPY